MNGYPSPKSAAKHVRRNAEKLAVGIIARITKDLEPVRKDGESIVETIARLVKESQTSKPAAEPTPDAADNS